MQEYLNAEDDALWGLVANGSKLRILRDNASLTRPSCIEADLDLMFGEELYPDFAALWLTAHASRFQPIEGKATHCIIETWRSKAHETGERIRENLREGVTEALRQLGNGFLQHPANDLLRESLETGALPPEQYFEQLLRLVYRMLFLFTVEERELLHTPGATDEQKKVFQQGYSISRLRERALRRRHYDRNADLWLGLLITIRACANGAAPLGLPALGGLFRIEQCPDLDKALIANENLLEAVRWLAFFRSEKDKALVRVNYRDMDTEELGSVYESLLELQPRVDANQIPWRFSFLGDDAEDTAKGSVRKLTGSYYTPPSLVNELIKSTLEPVIDNALAANPQDPVAAILGLRVIDPACGSGHFLLAAARRLADEIARIKAGVNSQDETSRQHALREVVQHCIYGVDRNPFAVELCKTALWMETVEPGKPLTFLDAQIVLGDSLVGILDPEIMAGGIPDKAFDPLTGDNNEVSKLLKKRNREKHTQDLFDQDAVLSVAIAGVDVDAMPEETLAEVEQKRAAWNSSRRNKEHARERLRADLFTGAFFAPKNWESMELSPHTRDLDSLAGGLPLRSGLESATRRLAQQHRFHHWHLEFAEIMQDGGFDAVLGNPPWGRIKLQEKKFFASRSPSIADAPNTAARDKLIQALNRPDADQAEKTLYRNFQHAKREAEAASQFARTSGRFPLAGVGDVNTYAVFAETFLRLVKPEGRAGLIVPSGIATDDTTKRYFQHLVGQQRLVSLFDFENREAVFPGVHRSYKFCLMTLAGKGNPASEAEFAFFLHQAEHLKEPVRRFTLTANDFSLFNPNTRNCPIFRTRRDMEIARKMYQQAGVLWKEKNESQEEENPWGISFQRMFDMANDSGLFYTREELEDNGYELEGNIFVRSEHEERYLPLYEAKLFHQYDHRFATFDGVSHKDLKSGNARTVTTDEKSDPTSVVIPRYWVSQEEVKLRLDKSKIRTQLEQNRTEQNRTEQNRTEQN
ncbi:MAG: N-6 DNA methylase, partial [Gammaproteobacteria bacterium]|nr:N-6 DNA methylase [Gammaproteobacteria bacterium]